MPEPVLQVRDLRVSFATPQGWGRVVNGISYDLYPGETLAMVGESGSGKSTSALALVKLLPQPPARIEGEVHLEGDNLVKAREASLRRIRGREIGMIFQDPMTSLNPVLTVGTQLTEGMRLHLGLSQKEARERAIELLERVAISSPEQRLTEYPHQLSGGQRQRVMIAIALACDPKILIADEATTALDVTIQAQILDVVERLRRELGMAVLWITHDLSVVASIAHRVMVLYAGQILEEAPIDDFYRTPRHPYTEALLETLPRLGTDPPPRLPTIGGSPPDPLQLPRGCAFYPRCPYRNDSRCEDQRPPLRQVADSHRVACFYDIGSAPEETS